MAGMKTLFTGTPKPKKDEKAERALKEQTRLEQERKDSAERQLASSRRARLAGRGPSRGGLAYVAPTSGPGATLG